MNAVSSHLHFWIQENSHDLGTFHLVCLKCLLAMVFFPSPWISCTGLEFFLNKAFKRQSFEMSWNDNRQGFHRLHSREVHSNNFGPTE